jgi:hypothetical protein
MRGSGPVRRQLCRVGAALTVAGLIAVLPSATAAASTVTVVTPTLTSLAGQATGVTYSVSFVTSSSGSLAGGSGTITLSAATGTSFPSTDCAYTVDDTTKNSQTSSTDCPTVSVASSGSQATLTLPSALSIGAGDSVVVTAVGVTNPPAGSDVVQVSTSTDTTAASSAALTIAPPQAIANATASLSSLVGDASGVTYTFGFDSSPNGGLVGGEGTFSISAPSGTTFPSTACQYEVKDVTSGKSGDCVSSLKVVSGGNTASFTLPASVSTSGGDNLNVVVSGVTNAPAGSEQFSLSDSSDSVVATTQTVVLSGNPGITSSVSDVTGALSSTAQGATGITYTVTFVPSSNGGLPQGGAVTLVAPVGTVFNAGNQCDFVDDLTTKQNSGGCNSASFAGDGSIMTVYSGVAINPGDTVSVTATNVANPNLGSTTVSVSTVSDGIFSTSPPITLAAAGSVSSLGVTPSTTAEGAHGVTDTITFTTSSNGVLEPNAGSITLEAATGTGFPSSGNCIYSLTDETTGASACAGIDSLGGASLASLVTIPVPNGVPIGAGDQVQLVVSSVVNPSASSLKLSVATSSDTVPASASASLGTAKSVSFATPALTLSSTAAGASGVTMNLKFATSSLGSLASTVGTVTLTGTYPTQFPGNGCDYQFDDLSTQSTGGCAPGVSDGASTVTVTVPLGIRAGDEVALTVTDVVNPGTGSLAVTLATSSDLVPVTTPALTIVAASGVSLSTASVSPTVSSAGGVTDSLSFKVSADGALEGGSGHIEVQGEPGTSFPGGSCSYQIEDVTTTTGSGCVGGIRVDAGGSLADVTLPSGFTISAGNAVTLTIVGGANPPGPAQTLAVWTSSDPVRTKSSAVSLTAGTSVTNPSLTVSTAVSGVADVVDTVTFDATTAIGSASVGGDGSIELAASPGTSFPGNGCDYTVTDVSTSTPRNCVGLSSPSPSTIDLSMPQIAVAAGQEVSIKIVGVVNTTAAAEALSVATSSDLVPAAATPVTLAAPTAPAAVSAQLSSTGAGATGVTDTIDLTASAQGAVAANAPYSVTIVGVPGTTWSGNGCDYTWTDLTTGNPQNCIQVGHNNNVLDLTPPFPIDAGDQIEITAQNAGNPKTTSQQFQVMTASDPVFADTTPVSLTGGTSPTADTGATLALASAAQGALTTSATISWTETKAAAAGNPVTIEASPGMVFDDGNMCDYTMTDVTSASSWQLCNDNSNAGLAGPNGNMLTFAANGFASAAGDKLQITVPHVQNTAESSSESVTIGTGADQTLVVSAPVTLAASKSVSSLGLAVSDPVAGRADATWTVTFTASALGGIEPGAAIVIETPPGTGLPGNNCQVVLADLSTQHSTSCVALSDSAVGDELAISTNYLAIRPGDQVSVTLPGMTNPDTSSAAVSVWTSTDTVPAASSPVTLTSGTSVTSPSLSLSTAAAGAGWVTGTFDFTTSASGALDGANDLISIAGGPGAAFPGNDCWYTVTDLKNGHSSNCVPNLSLDSSGSVVSFSPPGGLDIAAGDPIEVDISGMSNPPSGITGSAPGTASFDLWTTGDPSPVTVSEPLTAAVAPSNVSAALSDPVSGAGNVTASIDFTASPTGTLGPQAWIELRGAAGTVWPGNGCNYTITDVTTNHAKNCLSGLQITDDGSTALITTGDNFTVNPGDSVEVDVTGVDNPSATTDAIGVSTSSDPVMASSSVALSAPGSVSTPVLSASTAAAGAVDVTYSVSFATSATGQMANGQGVIELLGAPGTRLPGNNCDYTVTDTTNTHSVNCVNALALFDSGAAATFVVPSGFTINPGDSLVVQVSGVTNPPAGTGDAMSVATSSDTTPAVSNALSFVAGASPGSASLETSSGAVGQSGVTYSVGFTASSTGELASGTGTITLVASPGTAFGNNGNSWCATVDDTTTNRSSSCDSASIAADGSAVTITTGTTVKAGDSVVVTLTGVTNPPVTSNQPAQLWTSSDLVPIPLTAPNLSGDAISGTVETTSSGSTSAVGGVVVEACPTAGGQCVSGGTTGSNGQFSIAVSPGTYELQATPPPTGGAGSSSALQAAAYGPVTVGAGSSATGIVVDMAPEAQIPSGVSVNGQTSGVPTIYWGSSSTVTVTGCPGGMAEAVLQGTDTQTGTTIVRDVPLTESPVGSGTYTGTVPPLAPVHGNVTVAPFVYCAPLSAVLPYAGPTSGGTKVTIFGHGFTGATAVHFGSAAAADVTVVSDSEVTAVSPAGSGQVSVTVTTPAGVTPASSLATFSYLSVTGVAPATGNVSGGGTVLISGTGFTTAQQVFFGSTRSIFSVVNDQEIIAYVPPASSAGTVDITVETSGGASTTSSADRFVYSTTASTPSTPQQIPTPPKTGTPTSCATSGLSFCDAPPTQSISNAPPLSEGLGGTMPDPSAILTSLSSSATYAVTQGNTPPDNSGNWTPALQWNGSTDWIGNSLSIGDNLTSLMNGDVFASDIAEEEDFAGGFGSLSDTLAEVMADSSLEGSFLDFALGPVGGIALTAFSMWCSSAQPGGIVGGACAVAQVPTDIMDLALSASLNLLQKLWNMYIDPSGTVLDDKGNPIVGATVTILGSASGGSAGPYQAIPSGSVVTQPSTNPEISNASGQFAWNVVPGWYEIEASKTGCYAPGQPSVSDVVTPPFDVPPPQDGLELVMTCQSEPNPPPPTVTGLSASTGPAKGGTTISVEGTGFSPTSTVDFGSTAASSVSFVSSTTLNVVAPAGTGTVDVTVKGPGGTSATGTPDQFTYISAPTVTGLSLHAGTSAGGSLIEIDGTGFDYATSVLFGKTAAISFVVQSNTQIETTAPPGSGTVNVTVTSPDGSSATSSADSFTYVAPLAVTTSKLPNATIGLHYSKTLQASGGVAPYHWALTSGHLPPGLSFSSTGLISGVPTHTGTYDFSVKVSDSEIPASTVTTALSLKVVPNTGPGYWLVTAKGKVAGFGSALPLGSPRPSGTVVGIAALAPPSGSLVSHGYFVATATGHVYAFGAAQLRGHPTTLSSAVVGIAAAPKGDGYLLVTSKGMVYAYGTAKSYGHLKTAPKYPIVAAAEAPSGAGYWLLASNGAVYHFGKVDSFKSPASISGRAVALVPDAQGTGYWIATSTGKVYRFGTAKSYGQERTAPKSPITGMAGGPHGTGYWLVSGNGVVYGFGSAKRIGNFSRPGSKVVGIAAG